ncbi:MAG: Qat anti-phage system QueC-like protein QatC [Pseudomonadota bacterium]|nr:Qat anti-phage system QueC-like protein QatC [Pseudomonadota bacterium]
MRRSIFVRLGGKDEEPAEGTADITIDMVDNFGDLDRGLGQLLDRLFKLGARPSEAAVDLMILATAVYAADTGVSRVRYADDGWTRMIDLSVPVSDPMLWRSRQDHLSSMLKFLTGDHWGFTFRDRPDHLSSFTKQPEQMDLTDFTQVSLFSGGLDSLIGAIDLIASGQRPLLVSHYWDGEASSAQRQLLEVLKDRHEDAFESVRAYVGFRKKDFPEAGSDNNQRARSFLFYSLAVVAADAVASTNTVLIPENGLIALNVPMDAHRLGSLSTRTAHPHFIRSMSELVNGLGVDVILENPYRFKTKGEMARECLDRDLLAELAPASMSCSHPAQVRFERAPPQHCGRCVPCLIRRASLAAGLDGADKTTYFLDDLKNGVLDSKSADGKNIRSFMFAAENLRKNPSRARFLVQKPGPLNRDDLDAYVDVYRRGMDEVSEILQGVRAKHV